MARIFVALGVVLSVLVAAGDARADDGLQSSSSCGTANLLAGRQPWKWQDLRSNANLVTDGAVAPEGAQWDSAPAAVLETGAGSLTYDLGQATTVSAVYLQADANDTYKIFSSLDGENFRVLVEVENASDRGHGLRGRALQVTPTVARYLRVGEGQGDGFYSISEFEAYCQVPNPFPPAMRSVDAPQATVVTRPWYYFDWWQDKPSARLEMILAIAGCALLGWGLYLARKGRPHEKKKLRDRLLMLLGVLSFCAYWNFGSFHFGNYHHWWDTYHYYIGAKYFPELQYDRLYECASVADSEDPTLRRRVELRKIMNLRTNVLGSTAEILAHPELCKAPFTPERWEAFKKDIAFFRAQHGVRRWEDAQTDHGYNATPVWTILGHALSNTGPASYNQIWVLTRIDPLFIIGLCLMIWWAFGWRALCVSMIVFGTNFPSRFYWTGGAFLRWDWLFYMTAGVCLVKKEKYVVGGYFMAYSGLLRVFPAFLLFGPAMVLIQQVLDQTKGKKWFQRLPPRELPAMIRKTDRGHRAVVLGGILAVATLVPVSMVMEGGPSVYQRFLKNSEKHTNTPLTNYMGWRTVMTYNPNQQSRDLRSDRLEDPWKDWKDARLRTFHERAWLYWLGIIVFLAFLYKAVRGFEPWSAAALASLLIAVIPELTCYYYSFLLVMALLWVKRPEAGIAMTAVTAATGFIDMAPTQYLPTTFPWRYLQQLMPTWLAEQYTWMSWATLLGIVWVLYDFGYLIPAEKAALAAAPGDAPVPSESGKDKASSKKRHAPAAKGRKKDGRSAKPKKDSSPKK